VLGTLALLIGGLLSIVGIGGIGDGVTRDKPGQAVACLAALLLATWLVYSGFGLIEFQVYPCV